MRLSGLQGFALPLGSRFSARLDFPVSGCAAGVKSSVRYGEKER